MFRFGSLFVASAVAITSIAAVPNASQAGVPFGLSIDLGRNHIELSHNQRYLPAQPYVAPAAPVVVDPCNPPRVAAQVVVPGYVPVPVGVGYRGPIFVPHHHHEHHRHW
jgi:hypothetical protein